MPTLSGYHHVTLTVSDLDRSRDWYQSVLGLEPFADRTQGQLRKIPLRHPGSGLTLILVGHGDNAIGGTFSEFRAGLDHVAFAVTDAAALAQWRDRLDELGVDHSGVVAGSTGDLIVFRDPDNIQVEVYSLQRQ